MSSALWRALEYSWRDYMLFEHSCIRSGIRRDDCTDAYDAHAITRFLLHQVVSMQLRAYQSDPMMHESGRI